MLKNVSGQAIPKDRVTRCCNIMLKIAKCVMSFLRLLVLIGLERFWMIL